MSFNGETPPIAGLDSPAQVLLTGASSGIGLAMLRQLLDNQHVAQIFAVSRSATRHLPLGELLQTHGERLHLIDADLTDDAGLATVVNRLSSVDALHLVVNAAGVLHAPGLQPEKALEQLTRESLERVFALNAFAPIQLARALLPWLCHGRPVVFASLSARVGSIGDNCVGGWYAYRASKAALNQLMKTFAIEWKRRNRNGVCLLLHPGTVNTPLSAPFQSNVPAGKLFDPQRASTQLLRIIAESSAADSGRFIAWDGTNIPW